MGWFGTTAFVVVGLAGGILIPAGPVFGHVITGSLLLALFPGQSFWAIPVPDRHGQLRTVVGPLTEVAQFHGQIQR